MKKLSQEHVAKMNSAREAARKTQPKVNVSTLQRRRKNPEELPSRTLAIRNYCRECLGWDAAEHSSLTAAVKACTVRACWLHPYRCGAVDPEEY